MKVESGEGACGSGKNIATRDCEKNEIRFAEALVYTVEYGASFVELIPL